MQKVFTSVRLDAIAFVLGIFILLSGGLAPGYGQIVCQTLRSFGQQGSGNPRGSLIEGNDGALYGTTYGSGSNNLGTVFKLNRDGTGYAVIKYFAGNELQEFSNAGNHMKDKWLFFCGFVTACLATNLFAAAVPIAGYASPSLSPAVNQALNRMAIWDFHAVDDGTVPVEGDRATINALRNAGGIRVSSAANHSDFLRFLKDRKSSTFSGRARRAPGCVRCRRCGWGR